MIDFIYNGNSYKLVKNKALFNGVNTLFMGLLYIRVKYNGYTEYLSLRTNCNGLSQFNSFSRNQVEGFADYLGSEEKTLKTLERIRKGFASIFNQYLEQINKENEELYNAVEGLSKKLADSSVMEEKEDGTVEIHLGGKIFRGKIAED